MEGMIHDEFDEIPIIEPFTFSTADETDPAKLNFIEPENPNTIPSRQISDEDPTIKNLIFTAEHPTLSPSKKHICQYCSEVFSFKQSLCKHKISSCKKSPLIRTYSCSGCGKLQNRKDALMRHKLICKGVRQLECSICFKEFKHHHKLKRHMLTHERKQFYKCPLCSAVYVRIDKYLKHKKHCTGETKQVVKPLSMVVSRKSDVTYSTQQSVKLEPVDFNRRVESIKRENTLNYNFEGEPVGELTKQYLDEQNRVATDGNNAAAADDDTSKFGNSSVSIPSCAIESVYSLADSGNKPVSSAIRMKYMKKTKKQMTETSTATHEEKKRRGRPKGSTALSVALRRSQAFSDTLIAQEPYSNTSMFIETKYTNNDRSTPDHNASNNTTSASNNNARYELSGVDPNLYVNNVTLPPRSTTGSSASVRNKADNSSVNIKQHQQTVQYQQVQTSQQQPTQLGQLTLMKQAEEKQKTIEESANKIVKFIRDILDIPSNDIPQIMWSVMKKL